MITIEQLLESVDLDFEPRFVTRDALGSVILWKEKPTADKKLGVWNCCISETKMYFNLKLSEFEGKNWTECIYEVPRKTTGKIEKLEMQEISHGGENMVLHIQKIPATAEEMHEKINELVDAVNEINKNYACIAALTDIRKRLDTLEKCVKNKRSEE